MKLFVLAPKIFLLLLIGLLIYVMFDALYGEKTISVKSPLISNESPKFTLKTFDGNNITLDDFKGKAVLLNFWASWCNSCKQESKEMESSYVKMSHKNIEFIGVNVMDDKRNALKYLQDYGGSFIHAYDPTNKIHIDYGIEGVPETFFISPNGIVTDKYRGPLTEEIIFSYMEKALEYKEKPLGKTD